MTTIPKMSIAIPTHGMENKQFFMKRCLDSLWNQTFQDFEIVVTDNSDDDKIKEICDFYRTGIRYYRNPIKGMAQNTNEAIRKSEGELIKILYLDDFMAHDKALEKIVEKFDGRWLVTGCEHSDTFGKFDKHRPVWNDNIQLENTIGSPSVLTILNGEPLLFDENLTWLLDADLYRRYYDTYGEPIILNDINVIIGVGKHQATHLIPNERKLQENVYIQNKYV